MAKTSRSLQSIVPFFILACALPCLLAHAAVYPKTYLAQGRAPEWTSDGRSILYVDTCTMQLLMIPEGGGQALPIQDPSLVNEATCSPDGQRIAYNAGLEGRPAGPGSLGSPSIPFR